MSLKKACLLAGLGVLFASPVCTAKETISPRSSAVLKDSPELINTRSKKQDAPEVIADNSTAVNAICSEQEELRVRSKKQSAAKSRTRSIARSTQKRFVIDKIVARVNGVNILQSDLELPRIAKEGGSYSLEETISEELFVQRSVEQHLLPSELDIERQIVAFKMQNNMTDTSDIEFEKQLKQSGFTIKMYKEQLGRLIAVENVKRAEVSEKLVSTAQEVEEYHKKHPAYIKEAYHLKIAYLEKADTPEKEYTWEDLGLIEKTDLDKQFSFVPSMKVGETSQPVKIDEAYQVVQVVEKIMPRQKTLEECYIAIEKKLHQAKKEKYLKTVETDVRAKASIVYL